MRALSLLPLVLILGCGDTDTDTNTDTDGPDLVCEDPVDPPCIDDMILDLSLHDDEVSDGAVTNSQDGDTWTTTIDASAGGYQQASSNPWVYVKFTDEGAVRVDIDDESALESMEWHLSARRFILRLNGGASGPSCVGAAAFLESSFEDLTEVPDGLTYNTDDYYSGDCTIINDSSGLPGSPQVVLAPWWSYSACVATTGVPFLIQLDDGRVVKLVVDAYYGTGQAGCNNNDNPGDDSGNYIMRWKFME